MSRHPNEGHRVLEFYAGLGGLSAVWPEANFAGAIDIDRDAKSIFEENFFTPFYLAEIESIAEDRIASLDADVWWMSPPCLPFTKRGKQRDTSDPRGRSFLRLIDTVAKLKPEIILVENVPGFETSETFARLMATWQGIGYQIAWRYLCPTELGWPNRRQRVFVIASKIALSQWKQLPQYGLDLNTLLGDCTGDDLVRHESYLEFPTQLAAEKWDSLCRVDLNDLNQGRQIASCFTASYGRKLIGSGPYLLEEGRMRFFSPREVALILGFSKEFRFPKGLSHGTLWRLLGNSLSLPCVRYILSHLPYGPSACLPWI